MCMTISYIFCGLFNKKEIKLYTFINSCLIYKIKLI
uniref:Uncharacterized protein n=1 Tax=Osmundaria fimbriata TaxID=228265 RepID=A0A1Z1M4Y4_OSMFI|nr:hypothetical protein [Osmundaria fimbriata]ARW60855.1 hypothetical protein [Osmundaria fimbriata]